MGRISFLKEFTSREEYFDAPGQEVTSR